MLALAMLLVVATPAQVEPRIAADHGSVGVHAGYRYVPNPFFAESEVARDPVITTYLGAPTAGLRFDYFPMESALLAVDLDWTTERHELASGGAIELHAFGVGLSLGYKPDVDWWVHPYLLGGVDQVSVMVSDKILSAPQPSSSMWSAFGLHAAGGVIAPLLVPDWPWLGAVAEARYTLAPMTQRGRSFWVMGASLTVGLRIQFEAGFLSGSAGARSF